MTVATAALATITRVDETLNSLLLYGTITVGASPLTYTTAGIALSMSGFDQIKTSAPPYWAEAESAPAAGVSPSGYQYSITIGTTQAGCKLCIFTGAAAQSGLAELSNAATIPAGVSSDVIEFCMAFSKNI
jgi:hypothetical protein